MVFSYVKGIKIKITAKFRDTEHLRFEDKENYVTRKVLGLSRNGPLKISRSPFAIAVIIAALKVKIKSKITSYQLILDRVANFFPMQKKYI